MSALRDQLGQLLLVGFRGTRLEECGPILRDLREHRIGGVILFDQEMVDPSTRRRNVESPEQLRTLVAGLRAAAGRPLIVAIDQEGGRVNRLKPDYGFPPSVSHEELGRRNAPEETYRAAEQTARTLVAAGINLNLAPVVDLDANASNPIIKGKGRSFSADPATVTRHATAFIQAHRAHGVRTCLKHFPGHGSAASDTHHGLVDVTATWNERELEPFRDLIRSGLADAVMSAHVFHARLDPRHPATLSAATLSGLLRQTLGFGGVICSDDMEMGAISTRYGLEESVPAAVEAGVDLLCFGNNQRYDPDIAPKAIAILERAVISGRLSAERIAASVARIRTLQGAPATG